MIKLHTGEEEQKASGLDTNRGPEDVLMSHCVKSACVCSCPVCVHSASNCAVMGSGES